MRIFLKQRNQSGFTLMQAIFILVVLAFLGMSMMRLSAVQSSTSLFALQGARAYQAARSGLEWAAAQAVAGNCATESEFTLEGFKVTASSVGSVDID